MDSNMSRNLDNSDRQVQGRYVRFNINHRIDFQHHHHHVKSYTCSFCKRGFSNAQALGGHMNIHRKDRAKLRQLPDDVEDDDDDDYDNNQEVSLSLALKEQKLQVLSDHEEKQYSCLDDDDKKLGFWIVEGKLDTSEKTTELPFFVDAASAERDTMRWEKGSGSSNSEDNKEEKYQVMMMRDGWCPSYHHHHHDAVEGLDLELRLGQSLKNI